MGGAARSFAIGLTSLLACAAVPVSTSGGAVADASYVILLRHGDAPGRHEPAGFNLQDCATQRNLSDQGRNEARELGEQFRRQGVVVTKIVSSRWCRTRETAKLLGLGAVADAPSFDNLEFNKKQASDLLEGERQMISSWRGPGILVIVTHSSNIKALTGFEVEPGAMIVAKPKQTARAPLQFSKVLVASASF
jgi:phosphohistidine phosphatase SixA